jgi:hypothetical protein
MANLPAQRLSLAAAGLLLGTYGAYTWFLLLAAPGSRCGCGSDTNVSGWITARAIVLAVCAALPPILGVDIGSELEGLGPPDLALQVLAAIGLGLLIWEFPAAIYDPRASRSDPPLGERS